MPSAAKYRNRAPAKSVVPLSSIKSDEPSANPAWPPSKLSSEYAPVDVVGCPVKGDGRMPDAAGVGIGADAGVPVVCTVASAGDDVGGVLWTPTLRLRKDMVFT